jgi:hypothetical protein
MWQKVEMACHNKPLVEHEMIKCIGAKVVQKMLVKLTQGRSRNHCRQNTYCQKK